MIDGEAVEPTDMRASAEAVTETHDGAGEGGASAASDSPHPNSSPEGEGLEDVTALGGEAVVPEAYALSAPEGLTIDARALELATPVFRELGLSNDQAQALVPVAAEWAKGIRAQGDEALMAQVAAQRREWFEAARADAEIGGHQWSGSLGLAAKGLDRLGFGKGSPFRTLLDDSGLGNHPEMIRAWARVGRLVSEDGFERPGTPSAARKSDAELFYPTMGQTR